jgi:hypothetical protein
LNWPELDRATVVDRDRGRGSHCGWRELQREGWRVVIDRFLTFIVGGGAEGLYRIKYNCKPKKKMKPENLKLPKVESRNG